MSDQVFALSESSRLELRNQVADAFQAHHRWVTKVEDAIMTGSINDDLSEVAREDTCHIGRWLNGGISDELRNTPLYKITKGRHATFHRLLATTLKMVDDDDEEGAKAALADDGEFGQASLKIHQTLEQWLKMPE